MVGVGATAGTLLAGGYTPNVPSAEVETDRSPAIERRAARAPAVGDTAEVTGRTTAIARTMIPAAQAAPATEPTAAAAIAMRFPGQWQQPATAGENDQPAADALAYAAGSQGAEPPRQAEPRQAEPRQAETRQAEPAQPAKASGFQLASVDRAAEPPAMPKRPAKAPVKPAVLFNDAQLASIKARLRLTREQEAYWPKVEDALRAISWKLATQSKGIVGRNQASTIDPNSAEVARLKSAAFPLIMSMREDQKQEVRQLAHTMGLKQVASMF